MPWQTPTLTEVRSLVRDSIHGSLPGADATIPNSVLRVLGDAQGALCFLTLEYIDWLSLQLLPDTAETIWLDRHGQIWLVNADGSIGRKQATLANGTIVVTGTVGAPVPSGSILNSSVGTYQTTQQVLIGAGPTPVLATATFAGIDGNLPAGAPLTFVTPPPNVDTAAAVVSMDGGADVETDDELRTRVLLRIRQPPMGGDALDYVTWALRVPGVTRAWCYPLEMGIGTVTVRFMMDDSNIDFDGFPTVNDIDTVANYLNTVRPVAVKDFFVEAPIPLPVDMTFTFLNDDTQATRGAITESLLALFKERSAPGQTWYRSWTDEGIAAAAGVIAYDLISDDVVPSAPGYMPVLGDIIFAV
jgi:uncharacterized phage protein gp47/JayE